ncbi:MAG: N-acetylmuramoyl-L-alanine amidase [Clostridia bacterium]|nr:N-acetylmuramoyl-L-alanine amidase [Clostridia bacterium]
MRNARFIRRYANRILSCLALFALAFSLFPAAGAEEEAKAMPGSPYIGITDEYLVPVYAGAKYEIDLGGADYLPDHRDDGKMLTDRIYTRPDFKKLTYEGWAAAGSGSAFTATVTVDLGRRVTGLSLFFVRALKMEKKGIPEPKSIRFYCSVDGKDYVYVGEGATPADMSEETQTAIYYFECENAFEGRYVRVAVDCDAGAGFALNEAGVCVKARALRARPDENGRFLDADGMIYELLKDGSVCVTGSTGSLTAVSGSAARCRVSFDMDAANYKLGSGLGREVSVTADLINSSNPNWSGVANDIRYIIVHNTATMEEKTTAEYYNTILHTTKEEKSWHYTVDEHGIYHSLGDSIVGWHAGSAMNYNSIGIEMCVEGAPTKPDGMPRFTGADYDEWVNTRFRDTMKNTAVLVAELLVRYGLGIEAVLQHNDASGKECPLWMRYNGGNSFIHEGILWKEFMEDVRAHYKKLTENAQVKSLGPVRTVIIPDYVLLADGRVAPVTKICAEAFRAAGDSMTSLTLPETVKEIEPGAFSTCFELEEIAVAERNPKFRTAGGALCDDAGNAIFDPADMRFPAPEPKAGSPLTLMELDGRYYAVITEKGYTAADLIADYGAEDGKARNANGAVIPNGAVLGTGARVDLDGTRIYALVKGDGSGDGRIGAEDYAMAKRIYLGNYSGGRVRTLALAITDGRQIHAADYAKLKRHVLGTYDIYSADFGKDE